jgi:hypothetical protein
MGNFVPQALPLPGRNMYYKIVEDFGPQDADRWQTYIRWRGLSLTRFDSVDGLLRPDLFDPESDEDWRNCCVSGMYKQSLITSHAYAKAIFGRYPNAVLLGVDIELEEGYVAQDGFLGFDIIDGYCQVSLITNWGTDDENLFSPHVMPNGLIRELSPALVIRDTLRADFAEESHAGDCEVWAVYGVGG